jgi:O-antigen ligase
MVVSLRRRASFEHAAELLVRDAPISGYGPGQRWQHERPTGIVELAAVRVVSNAHALRTTTVVSS